MRKMRGFKIKISKQILRISKWVVRKTGKTRSNYRTLIEPIPDYKPKPTLTRLSTWARRLTNGARLLCSAKAGSGYSHSGHHPSDQLPDPVPRGCLAVYVGRKDGEFHRVHVPVIYFNHPLFGDLLREAEEEFGFCQQGGLTIPCPFSDFERVQTWIKSGSDTRKSLLRRHP